MLKDVIFIASYLGTHLLILGGGLWNLYGAGIFFQKFFNKLMQRERNFRGWKYFSKISYLPLLLDSPGFNWIPLFLLCTIVDQQTDVTCPQHIPARTKRHNTLRMKMKLNQDVRGRQKVRQWLRHDHVIGVCQSLSRAYFNFSPTLSVMARWIRKCT